MTEQQREHYHQQGYLVLKQALSLECVQRLTACIQKMIVRAQAGKASIKWVDREQGIPYKSVGDFLNKHSKRKIYDPYYAEWLNTEWRQQSRRARTVDICRSFLESG